MQEHHGCKGETAQAYLNFNDLQLCSCISAGAVQLMNRMLQVDPFCYQVYKSFTCCITSFLILSYTPFKFTYWGIVGGLIWVKPSLLKCEQGKPHLGKCNSAA